jgi:hypothetical protein
LRAYLAPENLKRYNSKWPEVKIFVMPDLFLTKSNIIFFVKGFIQINVILDIFQSNRKRFHLFVVVFVCIPPGWELYMTPRKPIGVWQGKGGSHR